MSLKILPLEECAEQWDGLLGALPARLRDVYFSAGYHLLWQRNGDGTAYGAVFDQRAARVLYPFLRRPLVAVPWLGDAFVDLSDISSCYGYGGPLVMAPPAARPEVLASFREAFSTWCGREGIVSEFIRFHPLLHNEGGFEGLLDLWPANETVVCRLSRDPEDHLSAMSSAARRNLRRAQKAGLTFSREDSDGAYDEFSTLYRQTMERRAASRFYLFEERYFGDLRRLLGRAQELLVIRHEGRMAAAALFLRSECFAHYHLGASDHSLLPLRPNNLLFFEALNRAGAAGLEELHLGGGYRAAGQDELLRFKSGFSPLRSRLVLGRVVHLEGDYRRAVARRQQTAPAPGAFFPAYRAPLS